MAIIDQDPSKIPNPEILTDVAERFKDWRAIWENRGPGPNYTTPYIRQIMSPDARADQEPEDLAYEQLVDTIATDIAEAAGEECRSVIDNVYWTLEGLKGEPDFPRYLAYLMKDVFGRTIDILRSPSSEK